MLVYDRLLIFSNALVHLGYHSHQQVKHDDKVDILVHQPDVVDERD